MAMRGFGWMAILVVVFFGAFRAGFDARADEGVSFNLPRRLAAR